MSVGICSNLVWMSGLFRQIKVQELFILVGDILDGRSTGFALIDGGTILFILVCKHFLVFQVLLLGDLFVDNVHADEHSNQEATVDSIF